MLIETNKALDCLPAPVPENALAGLLTLVDSLSNDVKKFFEGAAGSESLIQGCHSNFLSFKADIASTCPRFLPFTSDDNMSNWRLEFTLEDDQDQETVPTSPTMTMNIDDVREHVKKLVSHQIFLGKEIIDFL